MKKLGLYLVTFLTLILVIFTGKINASATEVPKSLSVGSSHSIPTYINGVYFGSKTLTNGVECYCLDIHKTTTQNVTVYLQGEKDAGFSYLLENGYPKKSITGDNNKDLYITQIAVWWYLDETTGSSNLGSGVKNTSNDTTGIKTAAKKLVDGAIKAKNKGFPNPKISASTTNNTLSITQSKKYYISNTIKVSSTDVETYKVSLSSAPSGSFIADTNGNKKTTFNAGDNFVVYVPVSSVTSTKASFKVNIESSVTYYKAYEYRAKNTSVQEIVPSYLYPTTKTVNTDIELNIFKSKVTITKIDADTNKQLKGATLVLKDSSGNVITSWVTTGSSHVIENLPKGTYTLQEIKAPSGYDLNEEVQKFTITDSNREFALKLYNHHSKDKVVKIIKLDKNTNKALVGAKLVIKDESGKVVDSFTSTGDYYTTTNLANGNYTLEETEAPQGYILDTTPLKFTVDDEHDTVTLKMYNVAKTKLVSILKVDSDTNEALEGAVLVIKDKDGKEIAKFTTTTNPYVLENINNGTYTVQEIEAPSGYILSDEVITFTISDDTTTAQVTFKNKKETVITEIPETGSNSSIIFYIVGGLIISLTVGVVYNNAKKQ